MSETADELIKEAADRIREKLVGDAEEGPIYSTIYGKPIDLDNPDHLLVAGYKLGQMSANARTPREHLDDFFENRGY